MKFTLEIWIGVPLQPTTTSSLGFTGELTDPLGLVDLRARTYNSTLGIFTQRDPVLGIAGLSASYNGYGYVHGNPTNYTDPSGEFAWLALIGIIVGAIYINDWRGQTYANQMQGMSFWDAVSYANNRPCPLCETVLSIAFPFLDTAFSARDFGYELSQGNIDVLSLLALLPLLDKKSMQAADDVAAMVKRGLRQGLDDLPSSIDTPAEQLFSNNFQVDEAGRIRVGRGDQPDFGASLRRRRAWYSDAEFSLSEEARASLRRIFDDYPTYSAKCDICADQVISILRREGIDAEIVRIQNPIIGTSRPPFLTLKEPLQRPIRRGLSPTIIGEGFHDTVHLKGFDLYLDSLVYERLGLHPVDWVTYSHWWEYPDAIERSLR
ncbi:MAG: RHS repeat-associated core domain-containing protein [Anaerolineae bacterium]|nr:RHS repeat-associated core domain-containing protein [Anaerolineae bacterium]